MAKRRRINFKFIVISALVLVGLAGVGLVLKRTVFRPNPDKFVAQAKEAIAKQDWETAAKSLSSAIRYAHGPDPSIWIMLADSYYHQTGKDFTEFTRQFFGCVNKALEIDPKYLPALRMMMEYQMDLVQQANQRSAAQYDSLSRAAEKVLAIEPKDVRAQFVAAYAVLDQRLNGVELDPKKLDDADKQVQALLVSDPNNAEPPFLLCRWRVFHIWEEDRQGNAKQARQDFDVLEKSVDGFIAAHKENAPMNLRMGQMMFVLADTYPGLVDKSATTRSTVLTANRRDFTGNVDSPLYKAIQAKRKEYLHKAFAQLELASKLVKPTDPMYVEIQSFYAQQLERPLGLLDVDMPRDQLTKIITDSSAKAEKLYRDILKELPGERNVRVQLADFLSRSTGQRREEAIALLLEPSPPNPAWIGVRGSFVRRTLISTELMLCKLRLDLVDYKTDRAERDEVLKAAQGDYDKLVSQVGESGWQCLVLKGRLQLLRNEPVPAVATFQRATQVFQGGTEDEADLKYQQARAFMVTNQTGQAKAMLRDVVAGNPGHLLARAQLAELLIHDGNIKGTPPKYDDGAIAQIDTLERLFDAENPMVLRLRLLTLDRVKDKAQFDTLWAKVPEKTVAERFDKARFAASMNNTDEAIRLFESVRAEKPAATDVIEALVKIYIDGGEKPKAIAVLNDAIAKNPQNQGLVLMREAVQDPAAAEQDRFGRIEKLSDPLRKQFALIDYYRDMGDEAKLAEALVAAEKLSPENPSIVVAMFELMLTQQNWERASAYLDRISKRNLDNANGQIYRVRLALAQGNLDQAQDIASTLTKTQSDFAQSWVLLGETLQARQKYDEAIAAYQEAQKRQSQNVDALRGLIECSYQINEPGRASNEAKGQKATGAKQYIEEAQRAYPNSQAFKELGLRWEMMFGDPERAIQPRLLDAKNNPDNPSAAYDLALAYLAAAEPRQNGLNGRTLTPKGIVSPASSDTPLDPQSKGYLIKARDVLTDASANPKFKDDNRFISPLMSVLIRLNQIPDAEKLLMTVVNRPENKGKPESANTMADFYLRVKQPEKAEAVLRDAIKSDPTNAAFETRLASILVDQGHVDEALKVLEGNEENEFVLRERLNVLLTNDRVADASKFVDGLVAKDPKNLFYQRLLANVQLSQGKMQECRATLDKLFAADPNDPDALFLRARTQLLDPRGDIGAAITDLNRLAQLHQDSIPARQQLAEAYTRSRMSADAIRVLQGLVIAQPNDKATRLKLMGLFAASSPPRWFDAENLLKDSRSIPEFANDLDFTHGEAMMWMQRGEPNKALDLMKQVIAKQPNNPLYVNTYLNVLTQRKDYSTLMTESERMVKAYPKLWWAYHYRAIAKVKGLNDRRGALADFTTAIQLALSIRDQGGTETIAREVNADLGISDARNLLTSLPGLDAHWQLIDASMLAQIGDAPSALAMIDKVLASPNLMPNDMTDALKIGGAMYMSSSPPNLAKAIEYYRRLIKEVPNDFEALNNVAYLLLEPGPTYAPQDAVQYSQHVLDLTRQQNATEALPLVMDTHAWALINCGKVDEGIAMLREALQKQPFPEAMYHLGEGYLKLQPPKLLDAERALLDGKQYQADAERQNKPTDRDLASKIDAALDQVKQLKK